MNKKILLIMLIAVLVVTVFQTVQLAQLSGAVPVEGSNYKYSTSSGSNAPSNPQNLPEMVGGC